MITLAEITTQIESGQPVEVKGCKNPSNIMIELAKIEVYAMAEPIDGGYKFTPA